MTTQELDLYLVQEKEKAEKALGCDMCKKYARCLYCFSKDEYRCAKAHERLENVLQRGRRKIPSYLLPEPPLDESEMKKADPAQERTETAPKAQAKSAPAPVGVKRYGSNQVSEEEKEPKEEMVETIAHILSEYKMNALSEERTQELMKISAMLDTPEEQEKPAAIGRGRDHGESVPLFVITRKRKYNS